MRAHAAVTLLFAQSVGMLMEELQEDDQSVSSVDLGTTPARQLQDDKRGSWTRRACHSIS